MALFTRLYKDARSTQHKKVLSPFWSPDNAVHRGPYELEDRGSVLRFQVEAKSSLFQSIQSDSGTHPASYSVGNIGSFRRG